MRIALSALLVVACSSEDRSRAIDERSESTGVGTPSAPPAGRGQSPRGIDAELLPAHRVAPDLATAIRELVKDDVRVVAFGELHARTDRATAARSALARFSDDVLPVIAERTSDLVIETWLFDKNCGEKAKSATAQVEATMQRPPETKSELATLVERARAAGVQPHAMRVTCDDWAKVAPPGKEVDYEAMLTLVTRELARIATQAIGHRDQEQSPRRLVAVYGGALHNDLHPIDGLADWSFAKTVDAAAPGGYLEIDLYVPEYAELDTLSQNEPWFPLVAKTAEDRVLIVERSPRSYLVLLPRAR